MIKKFIKWLDEPMEFETRLGFILYVSAIILISSWVNKLI
jgi:hypothetical protein